MVGTADILDQERKREKKPFSSEVFDLEGTTALVKIANYTGICVEVTSWGRKRCS